MHRALKDKCSNLCASMIVSLMPQDPLCYKIQNHHISMGKMTWKYKNFPKLFIIKKFYIKINAFQFC